MEKIQFDYYRGMEAEQYSFYRVPKILFTAECFKELSCEAKVLYGKNNVYSFFFVQPMIFHTEAHTV